MHLAINQTADQNDYIFNQPKYLHKVQAPFPVVIIIADVVISHSNLYNIPYLLINDFYYCLMEL